MVKESSLIKFVFCVLKRLLQSLISACVYVLLILISCIVAPGYRSCVVLSRLLVHTAFVHLGVTQGTRKVRQTRSSKDAPRCHGRVKLAEHQNKTDKQQKHTIKVSADGGTI